MRRPICRGLKNIIKCRMITIIRGNKRCRISYERQRRRIIIGGCKECPLHHSAFSLFMTGMSRMIS